MKTLKHITATIITVIIATSAFAQDPATWNETSNWLTAWKQVAGNQASPSWMLDQTDATARYWVSNDGTSLVIIREADFDDADDAVSDLEEEHGAGATRLWLSSEINEEDLSNINARFAGNLSGRNVTVEKAHLNMSGQWYTALVIGKGACNLTVLSEVNDGLAQQLVEHMELDLMTGTASK